VTVVCLKTAYEKLNSPNHPAKLISTTAMIFAVIGKLYRQKGAWTVSKALFLSEKAFICRKWLLTAGERSNLPEKAFNCRKSHFSDRKNN
jgi:hypothetical protein